MTTSHLLSNTRAGSRRAWWSGWALLLLLFAGLLEHFVPSGALLSGAPLNGKSYDRHVRQVMQVGRALQRDGHSWFYNPQWLAGQAEGTVTDLDSKAWTLWTFALSNCGLRPAIAFNSFMLLVMCLAPICMYWTARAFELSPTTSLIAAWLAVLLWFFDSYVHWSWFVGALSWCGAACLSVAALACFHRWLISRRHRDALWCACAMALALLFHGASALTLLPVLTASTLHALRTLSPRERLTPLWIAALALVPNAYWLVGLIRDWQLLTLAPVHAQAFPDQLLCDLAEIRCQMDTTGDFGTRSGLRVSCFALAMVGLHTQRKRGLTISPVLLYGLLLCHLLSYLGFLVPGVRRLQPYQQIIPALLLTTLPAAWFLRELTASARQLLVRPRWALALTFALSGVLSKQFLSEVTYFFPELVPTPKPYNVGVQSPLSQYGYLWPDHAPAALYFGFPLRNGGIDEVARWLRLNAQPGARMLVANATLAERLAWREGFEILGGELARWPLDSATPRLASVRRWFPTSADDDGLSDYLRAYAVDWVVANHQKLRRTTPALEQVAVVSGEHIYRSQLRPTRILQGGGAISANPNVLKITGSDPNQPLVLSYHWHAALRCTPDCRVERTATDISDSGFVRVPAPHASHLTVWNSYVR